MCGEAQCLEDGIERGRNKIWNDSIKKVRLLTGFGPSCAFSAFKVLVLRVLRGLGRILYFLWVWLRMQTVSGWQGTRVLLRTFI